MGRKAGRQKKGRRLRINVETKLRWFDRGAKAFQLQFPGEAERHGFVEGELYVCPLCDRGFKRPAVAAGLLTAEHVPPAGVGGQEWVLTCSACNSTSGHKLDAHAKRQQDLDDVMAGRTAGPLEVRFGPEGLKVRGRLSSAAGGWSLQVVERNNNPGHYAAFRGAEGIIRAGTPINIEFLDKVSALGVNLSWFRAGFLALFAFEGYRYTFDPALKIVKRQLVSDDRLIYTFQIVDPALHAPAWDWSMFTVPHVQGRGVRFGSRVLLYPRTGDLDFYARVEEHAKSAAAGVTRSDVTPFKPIAHEPTFGLGEAL